MEKYPDYVFTGSQVQQYEWLKELYPKLFEKIQKAEKNNQWELIGGVSINSEIRIVINHA
jgi:alpha-mannosidase